MDEKEVNFSLSYEQLTRIGGSRSNDVKNHAKRLIHCLY